MSRVCHRIVSSSVASVLILVGVMGRTAHAGPTDDEPVTLSWTAPKECPTGAEVTARTAERLPPDATVRAKGRVEKRESGRYRLVLEIEARGERVIEAATCDALASSAAVVLAMSVAPPTKEKETSDKEAAATAPSGPSAPSSSVIESAPDRDGGASPTTRDQGRTTFGVRLQAIGDVGSLPAAAAGAGLAIGLDPIARLHLEIGGNFWAAQDGTLASDPSRGASFHLYNAGARGCFGLTAKPVVLAPCLGAEIIVLSARGFGAARPADATSVTWAPEAAATLTVALSDFMQVRAGLGAAAPTSRQAFVIAAGVPENSEVHRVGAVALRGWIGPEVVF